MSLQPSNKTCCPSQATLAWCLCKAGLAYAGRAANTHEGRPGAVFGGRSLAFGLDRLDTLDLGAADHIPATILDNPTFSRPPSQEEGP